MTSVASVVTVETDTELGDVDFVLTRGFTVRGAVTTSSGASLAVGASVSAKDGDGQRVAFASLEADGTYVLADVHGTVWICVEVREPLECWDNASTVDGGSPVFGGPGEEISEINFVLGGPGAPSGLVASAVSDDVVLT